MGKIAFLFAGQGAQYPGMGKELYENNSAARAVFDTGEKLRRGTLTACFEGSAEELSKTENTQPCLFLCDLACAEAVKSCGINADVVAGFSLGEVPALAYAGCLSYEDAFKAVCVRGKAMNACAEKRKGGMAAVLRLSREQVEGVCAQFKEVYPVNYNCPGQISCAGAAEEIDAFCAAVKDAGGRAVKLAVSGAFHTPFMVNAKAELEKCLSGMKINPPATEVYSNMTAGKYPREREEIISLLSAQLCNRVYWEQIIRGMCADGVDTFIEVGAGKTLSGLVAKTAENVRIFNVCDLQTLEETVKALKK